MIFAFLPEWLQQFGGELGNAWPVFVAVIAIIGALYKLMGRIVKKVLHETVVSEIRPLNEKVDSIQEQFKNNGGSSMKDAVDKVNRKLDENKADLVVQLNSTREEMLVVNAERDKRLAQIHEDLMLQNSRIAALTANTNAAYYEIDENADLTYVNDNYLELFQVTLQEAMSNQWRKWIDPADLSRVDRSAQSALRNRGDWTCDFTVIRRDGTKVKVIARAFPIWDGEDFAGYAGAMTWDN